MLSAEAEIRLGLASELIRRGCYAHEVVAHANEIYAGVFKDVAVDGYNSPPQIMLPVMGAQRADAPAGTSARESAHPG